MGIARLRKKWPLVTVAAAFVIVVGTGSAFASILPGQSSIPFGQPMSGSMTYYNDIGTDACGGQINPTTQALVAVSHVWWTAANPNNDPLCNGVSVQLTYNGQTITLPVVDACASCDATHIDVSQAVFQQFAPLSVGLLTGVTWQFVSSSTPVELAMPQTGPSSPPTPSTGPSSPPTPSTGPSSPPPPSGGCAAPWDAGTSYVPGNVVSHNGDNWTSTWWSTGAEPGAPISWNVWSDDGPC
jgi:chitodextrinase